MKKTKQKKFFLPAGCGGGFAGILLYLALREIAGESITWWMGPVLMIICIMVGVVFQALDERKIERDVIVRKDKKQNRDDDLE